MWDKPRILNWIANLLYALVVVLMLYALLFVVVHLPIFPIREVKVDGQLAHVNREQIKLIVAKHLQGNFFTLDLEKTRDAFEKLPWVRNCSSLPSRRRLAHKTQAIRHRLPLETTRRAYSPARYCPNAQALDALQSPHPAYLASGGVHSHYAPRAVFQTHHGFFLNPR